MKSSKAAPGYTIQGVQRGDRTFAQTQQPKITMLKNIAVTKDFILSLDSGRVLVRAVSQKGEFHINQLQSEVKAAGLTIGNTVSANYFTCHSQFHEPIEVLAALKAELESQGYTVAIPEYEMGRLQKPETDEETISIICSAD